MKLEEDCNDWGLRFSSCQFSEDQRPFKFCLKGIIGILCAVVILCNSVCSVAVLLVAIGSTTILKSRNF